MVAGPDPKWSDGDVQRSVDQTHQSIRKRQWSNENIRECLKTSSFVDCYQNQKISNQGSERKDTMQTAEQDGSVGTADSGRLYYPKLSLLE